VVAARGTTSVRKTRAGDAAAGERSAVIVGRNETRADEKASRLGKPTRREGSPSAPTAAPGPER
jgi:hypothetical protein